MTEAQLEAQVFSIIQNAIPTLTIAELKLQHNFSFQFGHHNVLIDGKKRDC